MNISVSNKKEGWFINLYINVPYDRISIMVSDITELYFQGAKINTYPDYFKNEFDFVKKVRKFRDRLKYIKTENWGMTEEYYFKDGELHRLWGPAIEYK